MALATNSSFESHEDWQNFCQYLKKENRYHLSAYWRSFVDRIIETSVKRTDVLTKDIGLVRARIGSSEVWCSATDEEGVIIEEAYPEPSALSKEDMGAPPPDKAIAGRANPHGMANLYLSNNETTAIAETRPWVGANVSVGYFTVLADQKILDLTKDKKTYDMSLAMGKGLTDEEKEDHIWSEINKAFSRPMGREEDSIGYLPTQYLAEVFKAHDFNGLFYKSSLNVAGYNIVLFNPAAVKLTSCQLVCINKVNYSFDQIANPYFCK